MSYHEILATMDKLHDGRMIPTQPGWYLARGEYRPMTPVYIHLDEGVLGMESMELGTLIPVSDCIADFRPCPNPFENPEPPALTDAERAWIEEVAAKLKEMKAAPEDTYLGDMPGRNWLKRILARHAKQEPSE